MPGPRPFCVVLVTAPNSRVAQSLAKALVAQRLAACVNVIPRIASYYRWEGRLCRDAESLLLIKTSSRLMPALSRFVKARHPYKLPEVISLAIAEGSPAYLDWLKGCLARP